MHLQAFGMGGCQDLAKRIELRRLIRKQDPARFKPTAVVRIAAPANLDKQRVETVARRRLHHVANSLWRRQRRALDPQRPDFLAFRPCAGRRFDDPGRYDRCQDKGEPECETR